jgi:hypothetical protein
VVGEPAIVAMAVYPDPGVRLLEEETPQEAKSAVPVGLTVALTVPLEADPVPTGPSTDFAPPEVS